MLTPRHTVRLLRLHTVCRILPDPEVADNTESTPVNYHFLFLLSCRHYRTRSLSSYLYVSPPTLPASLSGRKPRAFGSYMKYESESHWMRIVRSCRWSQSQQQWGVTSARLSFNLRELQAPCSPCRREATLPPRKALTIPMPHIAPLCPLSSAAHPLFTRQPRLSARARATSLIRSP